MSKDKDIDIDDALFEGPPTRADILAFLTPEAQKRVAKQLEDLYGPEEEDVVELEINIDDEDEI